MDPRLTQGVYTRVGPRHENTRSSTDVVSISHPILAVTFPFKNILLSILNFKVESKNMDPKVFKLIS